MLFPTYQFLGFFLIVFTVYWSLPWHRVRLSWLLLASIVFYMSWNPWFILLILFSATTDYFGALGIERVSSPRAKRWLLVGSITVNLGLLAYFKYANFFLDNARELLAWWGWSSLAPTLEITLPLGISFYTFETISYIVDVYRGRSKAIQNPLDYALFILFFPHLVAGPIVRPYDFIPQLARHKHFHWTRMYLGVRLFLVGFIKKAVMADHLAKIADPVFAHPESYGSLSIWAGVLAYTIQIYCDFSGYSDMAIGLAHLLGFKLPDNFRFPYLACDMADFWRRWHISLSTWLRDYLYIPLGGSRDGTFMTCRNLFLVMLLGGLWHGASWTFLIWGMYHGILLVLHRLIPWPTWTAHRLLHPLWQLGTLLLVAIGWVFFRAPTFTAACTILHRMFLPVQQGSLKSGAIALSIICLVLVLSANTLNERGWWPKLERKLSPAVVGLMLAGLLILAQLCFPEAAKSFIYFQF